MTNLTATMKKDIVALLIAAVQEAQQSHLFEATTPDTKRYLVMASSNTLNLVQRMYLGKVWRLAEVDDRFTNLAYWIRCAKQEGEQAHPAQTTNA